MSWNNEISVRFNTTKREREIESERDSEIEREGDSEIERKYLFTEVVLELEVVVLTEKLQESKNVGHLHYLR